MGDEIRFAEVRNGALPALRLAGNEVHLWCARFDLAAAPPTWLEATLTDDERERAARFVFPRDHHRWVFCRGWLRRWLAVYVGAPARSIRFEYNPQGKPSVAGGQVDFNLSHSGMWGVFAFARTGPLGVDVEEIRPMADLDAIAQSHFSARECETLRQLPPDQRQLAFYRCWTRKEAWLKAIGLGLSGSLDGVEVTLRPNEPARLLALSGSADAARQWSLHHLEPASDYLGCLALPAGSWELKGFRLSESELLSCHE